MNLDTKMVLGGDERQTIEFTRRFLIKPGSGPVSLDEAKRDNDEILEIDFSWKFSLIVGNKAT